MTAPRDGAPKWEVTRADVVLRAKEYVFSADLASDDKPGRAALRELIHDANAAEKLAAALREALDVLDALGPRHDSTFRAPYVAAWKKGHAELAAYEAKP